MRGPGGPGVAVESKDTYTDNVNTYTYLCP
jgi:hypothetical protein